MAYIKQYPQQMLGLLVPAKYYFSVNLRCAEACPLRFDRFARTRDNWVLQPVAGVTQLVECDLAKVDVAGSNPVSRSIPGTNPIPCT